MADTDRALLEAAARAAGIGLVIARWVDEDDGAEHEMLTVSSPSGFGRVRWNPLTDDGDALRLAVKLNLDIRFDAQPDGATVECVASYAEAGTFFPVGWLGKDPFAATRRAIVRAAASLAEG